MYSFQGCDYPSQRSRRCDGRASLDPVRVQPDRCVEASRCERVGSPSGKGSDVILYQEFEGFDVTREWWEGTSITLWVLRPEDQAIIVARGGLPDLQSALNLAISSIRLTSKLEIIDGQHRVAALNLAHKLNLKQTATAVLVKKK